MELPAVRGFLDLTSLICIQFCICLIYVRGVTARIELIFLFAAGEDILLHRRILLVLRSLANWIATERLEAGGLRLLLCAAAHNFNRDIVVC